MSNKYFNQVKEFHQAFNHPIQDNPTLLHSERAKARYDWMIEECNEFIESNTVEEQADAMIDLIYFAIGTLVEMGVKPDALFDIVHQANMSKLFPDGKPHYRADGKTIKPPNWQDPKPLLIQEIKRQLNQ